MTKQGATKQVSQHVLAFIAAGLFSLAGFIEIATALRSRGTVSMSIGAMFLCIGILWVVIGSKYKSEGK